jgi:hypothetical protein
MVAVAWPDIRDRAVSRPEAVPALRTPTLQLRSARRVIRRRGISLRGALSPVDDRMVFVLGCPRSGTTFLARAIGSCPGMVDLGEVAALKAAIPEMAGRDPVESAPCVRRLLNITRRLALTGGVRAVEQTPETAFIARAIDRAFPRAHLVHIIRDGRDVVCSLLERGWLNAGRRGVDDAGIPHGSYSRFWVEAGRDHEFEDASDVRRAAWAWRRYVAAGRNDDLALELRYERLVMDPAGTARALAGALDVAEEPLRAAFEASFSSSVGRFRADLSRAQVEEVEVEAGPLLHELGYT